MSIIGYSPVRMFRDFERTLEDDILTHRNLFPYWRSIPHERYLNLGVGLGGVENTPEKFAASVDVSHFKPEEIKVNLNGNELTIEGDHEEKNDAHGTIKRSFVRKYFLPEDTNLESLRSSLNDKGHLTVEAPKKTQTLTQTKAIPITRG